MKINLNTFSNKDVLMHTRIVYYFEVMIDDKCTSSFKMGIYYLKFDFDI